VSRGMDSLILLTIDARAEEAPGRSTPPTQDAAPDPHVASVRDRLWALLMRVADAGLRRWYGVREFTDDPSCLLRLALAPAPREVTLSDGTRIEAGETVIMLHIWNEQVPRFRLGGPDLRWAIDVRRRLRRSFWALAKHLEEDPAWTQVRGIHACVVFGSRRRREQIRRAAEHFGFELIGDGAPAKGWHEWGEDFLIWAFARAFNPGALRRSPFWRDRTELWISREALLRRYL
jgi:hypothetical protein